MRLKRLTLHGYKTFATKTEFEFGRGITAIVGPNGCGKSNIADAIRWVLGEQSYSTLRGRRTTDMIFTGSRTRPRAGMAQATLSLDNRDGWLSLDFSEIEIGRRAYRSGENEYIVNQQKVRLRDVNELLADSGLGERTYTIIGQGLVDQALSLRADERRALFEEAAGILHYKVKRAETIRHLDETRRNLERVNDIISEIEPRLRSLKRQANRARNYEHVATDLHHHLRIWFGYHWDQARSNLRNATSEGNKSQETWSEGRKSQVTIQRRIDELRRDISGLQSAIQSKEDDREQLRNNLEEANREAAILAERLEFTQRRIAEIENDVPRLQKQRGAGQDELDRATLEFESATKSMDDEIGSLEFFEQKVHSQQELIEKWETSIVDLDTTRLENRAQINQAAGSLSQLRERLDKSRSERPASEEVEEAEAGVARNNENLNSARKLSEGVSQRRIEIEQELALISPRLEQTSSQINDAEINARRLQLEHSRLDARYQLLETVSDGIRLQLPESMATVGYLDEMISIPSEYSFAISSALRDRIWTLVADGNEQLWTVANLATDKSFVVDIQALSLPPKIDSPEHPSVIGWADEFVDAEKRVSELVELLLGHVLLVAGDAQTAYEIARKLPLGCVAVTLDGLLIYAGGLVETPISPEKDTLNREEELQRLKAGIDENKVTEQRWQDEADKHRLAMIEIQGRKENFKQNLGQLSKNSAELDRSVMEASHALDTSETKLKVLSMRRSQLSEESNNLTERIRISEQLIGEVSSSNAELDTEIERARLELKELPAVEIADERRHLEQSIEAARTIVAGRQAVVDSRRVTLVQVEEQLDRLVELADELRSRQLDLQLEERISAVKQLRETMDTLKADLIPLQGSLREKQDTRTSLEQQSSDQLLKNQEAESRYLQARLALNQAENRLEGLRERISSDLGLVDLPYDDDQLAQSPLPISDIVDQLPVVVELPDDIEKTIQRFRGQLHRMGGVNSEAPVEYDETKQRYDFLKQQVVDLTATIDQLDTVIAELDELTSQAFVETVQKVDENFGEVFRRLFGGGSGRLVLTDPDNLISTGVEIVARLPNRKEQALGLLSGGERSLTATALVFALLKVSPTPFCVLDEVDAMLDEANINRFRELLKELSQETQFIIITHNRGTVQVAESVYGVSMGADSVSQVISIKPEDYIGVASTD